MNSLTSVSTQMVDPIRITQVQNELDRAGKGIETLHILADKLRERLTSVLKTVNAAGECCGPQPPQPMLVPLADAMRQRNQGLEDGNRMLEEILSLLDL